MAARADFDSVILAGGRATRLAGFDKPGLAVGGRPMLVSVVNAAVEAGHASSSSSGPTGQARWAMHWPA